MSLPADTAIPPGFLLGAATSGHQVEGNDLASDWWDFEHHPASPCVEPSGDACDHYHRYPRDLRLLAELGLNAFRFSIEWSRVEPEPGRRSSAALAHYGRVATECRALGLTPVVTLNHYALPRWVTRMGGWESHEVVERFADHCHHVAIRLGTLPGAYCTLNEPNVPLLMLHDGAASPLDPGRRHEEGLVRPFPFVDPLRSREVLLEGHRSAVCAIRAACSVPVGMTLLMHAFEALPGGEDRCEQMRRVVEDELLACCRGDDFVGVQNYGCKRVGPDGVVAPHRTPGDPLGLGWHPAALATVIRRAARLSGCTVLVTEHGTCVSDDARRVEFLREALDAVAGCLADGVDVAGYLYWSAFDNFEWTLGYGPKFGLVEVDRASQRRRARASARWLGERARAIAPGPVRLASRR